MKEDTTVMSVTKKLSRAPNTRPLHGLSKIPFETG